MAKISEELLYDMFDDGIYTVDMNRDGTVSEIEYTYAWEDYDEFIEYFGDYYKREYGVAESVFNTTKQYLENLIYNAEFYDWDGGGLMLQLHDNHTFWRIDAPVDEYELNAMLDSVADKFTQITGQKVYGCGRSGRHICVDFTFNNLINYDSLRDTALELEQEFLDIVNAFGVKE